VTLKGGTWGTIFSRHFFHFHRYTCNVWPRTTKFSMITRVGEWCVFRGQPRPIPRGRGRSTHKFWGTPTCIWPVTIKFGGGHVCTGSGMPHLKGTGYSAPNFWDPHIHWYRFIQSNQICHINSTKEQARFYSQTCPQNWRGKTHSLPNYLDPLHTSVFVNQYHIAQCSTN